MMLTNREKQVFDALVNGKSALEIAAELKTSVANVKFHNERIYKKYEVKCCKQLLAKVIQGQEKEIGRLRGDLTEKESEKLTKNVIKEIENTEHKDVVTLPVGLVTL